MSSRKLKQLIALAALITPEQVQLERPAREDHGDWATNVALTLFARIKTKNKQLKAKTPLELARQIVNQLEKSDQLKEIVEKVEVAGPGFINFRLRDETLINELRAIIKPENSLCSTDQLKGKKILVEYGHPNTHKQLHIGHLRTLITGEGLARIFKANGASVFRANYQGDIGPQVAKAIWGGQRILAKTGQSWDQSEKLSSTQKADLLGRGYVLGNQAYTEHKREIDQLNARLYLWGAEHEIYQQTRAWSLDYFNQLYRRFGTKFDRLYFESQVASEGKKIVQANLGTIFQKSDQAVIFDGQKYGLHKRVFITAAGHPTYEAKELALAPTQFNDFPFDQNIKVVANEQAGYFQVTFKVLELIEPRLAGRLEHVAIGLVQLVGRKMSSRTGDIVTADDLLDQVKAQALGLISSDVSAAQRQAIAEAVTIGAIKYSMLKVHPTGEIRFDPKESVSLEGDSGPYLLYTLARCRSLLEKVKTRNQEQAHEHPTGLQKMNQRERAIASWISRFESVLAQAALDRAPSQLCGFLHQMARRYNSFYAAEPILKTKEANQKTLRLLLTQASARVLHQGLDLLGIKTLERM